MRHDRRACFTATLASTALFAGLVATAMAGCAASQGVAPATASTPAAAQARATAPPKQAQRRPPSPARAGEVFKDCAECPEMVVIGPGRFVMGSRPEDRRRLGVHPKFDVMEAPLHEVRIGYHFAYGRYSVTFDEWDACVAAGGCNGYVPPDEGWGRGRRPVIHVNYADAQSYVSWLSARTGERYRLPHEAEFEYAARGGTTTAFHTGDDISPEQGNFGELRGRTMPVGTFPPNPFGLYEINGNVAQWMQDCHHDDYVGAPTDGSAWLTGPCETRDVRGGGWSLVKYTLRTAQRIGDPPQQRNSHLGFRVVRELPR